MKSFLGLVVLFIIGSSLCLSPPPTITSTTGDKELKPTAVDPNKKGLPANTDDYTSLNVPWKEYREPTPKQIIPQTGNLIQSETTGPVDDLVTKSKPVPVVSNITVHSPIAEIPMKVSKEDGIGKPNLNAEFPVKYNLNGGDTNQYAYSPSADKLSPPPITDPNKKDIYGFQPPPIQFILPVDKHPMEVVTPLHDNFPCNPDRIIKVTIPSTYYAHPNDSVPYLPGQYGCSSESDGSREKASPSVSWTNIDTDTIDFSLQLIQLGEGCLSHGEGFGSILWHVEGIKSSAATVTLQEGASHDSRLLFGGKELVNQWLEEYYSGPCPHPGTTGCYRFKVLSHRQTGTCQCGYSDVLFSRPAKPQEWTYQQPDLSSIGTKKD